MRITAVGRTILRIPLETPVLVGSGLRITEREYLLVAIDTDTGLRGVGWSFTRGGDLAGEVQRLQPLLDGEDPLEVERLWERMAGAHPAASARGTTMRALSALDTALWDIKGQAAGLPLHRLFGGCRTNVQVLMAGMYYTAGRRPDDDAREAAVFAGQGFRAVKMMGGAAPFSEDLERMRAVRRVLGHDVRIGLDVNGAWTDPAQAVAHTRALAELDVAFVEEPLPAGDITGLRTVAAGSPVPLAVGETVDDRQAFRELVVNGVAILRPDATVVGGISEWLKVCGLGLTAGLRIIPHYFPEVHIHMAAAFAGVEAVEYVTTAGGISNFHRIVREPIRPDRGVVRAPSAPGLGLELDWDAVERFAVKRYARG